MARSVKQLETLIAPGFRDPERVARQGRLDTEGRQVYLDGMAAMPTDLQSEWMRLSSDDDPLDALRAAGELREGLGRWESQLARKALASGETWETIGAVLGISRQAAWERLRPAIGTEIRDQRARVKVERDRVRDERRKRARPRKAE